MRGTRLLLSMVLLTGLFALPGAARAGEAQDALVPQEVAVLRRTFPGWDDLAAERRERIAKNVLGLRHLTPDERARFLRRVRELETRKLDAERLEKVRSFAGDPKAAKWRFQALVAGALGRALAAEVAPATGPDVEPQRAPPPAVLGFAFYRALQQQVARDDSDEGRAREYEPTVDGRTRYDELKSHPDPDGAKDLRRFVLEDRTKRWIREALGPSAEPGAAGAPSLDRVVASLRETYPRAYDRTLAFVRSPEGAEFLRRFGSKPEESARGRRFDARRAAVHYLGFLEQAAGLLARDPEAREHADALLGHLFVKGMGVPQAEWDRLPSWDRPGDRLRFLKRLVWARRRP